MKKEKTFEESLKLLEENVSLLEKGDIGLDESIKIYEESIALAKYCDETLKSAEKKVAVLLKGQDGKLREEEFKGAGDE
jgi:exodeoxyribonuclease VII small subunit